MVSAGVVIFMIVAIILSISVMVLSAMAANEARKSCKDAQLGCHRYATWSSVVTGLVAGLLLVLLIVYIYTSRKEIAKLAHAGLGRTRGALGAAQGAVGRYAGVE